MSTLGFKARVGPSEKFEILSIHIQSKIHLPFKILIYTYNPYFDSTTHANTINFHVWEITTSCLQMMDGHNKAL